MSTAAWDLVWEIVWERTTQAMQTQPRDPLLSVEPPPRKRACTCCAFLCHLVVLALGALLGAAGATVFFVIHSLGEHTNTSSAAPTTCPGVCASRSLHGHFATNVSASKSVGPVTVVVKFRVQHTFDWEYRIGAVRVDPIDFEPHWLPNVLHPIACEKIPFNLGDSCNVTLDSACTRAAFKKNDIEALTLLWDPALDALAASETVNTGFFRQVFEWVEPRM